MSQDPVRKFIDDWNKVKMEIELDRQNKNWARLQLNLARLTDLMINAHRWVRQQPRDE